MGRLGVPKHVIAAILNHRTGTKADVTARVYNLYDYDEEKREA
jgi:hypothetical protein